MNLKYLFSKFKFKNGSIKKLSTLFLSVLILKLSIIVSAQENYNYFPSKSHFMNSQSHSNRLPSSLVASSSLQNTGLSNYYQLVAYNDTTEYKTTINKLIPNDLEPTSEPSRVFNKIADRGLNTLIASENFKQSTLGKLSDRVKEKASTDIQFKSNLLSPVVHDFKAELDPFQGQTKLKYSGFFLADLILKENELNFKIQNYFFNKKLYYERHFSKNSRLDQVGIKWEF